MIDPCSLSLWKPVWPGPLERHHELVSTEQTREWRGPQAARPSDRLAPRSQYVKYHTTVGRLLVVSGKQLPPKRRLFILSCGPWSIQLILHQLDFFVIFTRDLDNMMKDGIVKHFDLKKKVWMIF